MTKSELETPQVYILSLSTLVSAVLVSGPLVKHSANLVVLK